MASLANSDDLNSLLERLDRLAAGVPPRWGVLTAHQMVQHLADAMEAVSRGIAIQAPPSPLRNGAVRFLVLRSPIEWAHNFPTVPELDLRGKPKPDPARFDADRERLREGFRRFAALDASSLSREHPYFGPMTHEEWMLWAWRHADHHLRQFAC